MEIPITSLLSRSARGLVQKQNTLLTHHTQHRGSWQEWQKGNWVSVFQEEFTTFPQLTCTAHTDMKPFTGRRVGGIVWELFGFRGQIAEEATYIITHTITQAVAEESRQIANQLAIFTDKLSGS